MDNLEILIQAILSLKDATESKKQIISELPKLESQLQSDKNARVKIIAGLDIAKSKNLIQSQLTTLANQTNAPTIKVGVDVVNQNAVRNIATELKDVQVQAQQTANIANNSMKQMQIQAQQMSSSVESKIITVEKTLEAFKQRWLELHKAEHNGNVNTYSLQRMERDLQEIVPFLEKDTVLLNDLYNNVNKFNSTEGLRHLSLSIRDIDKEWSTFKSVQNEVNKQFQQTITFETNSANSTQTLYERFRILTNQLLKYEGISKSITQLGKKDISNIMGSVGISDHSLHTVESFYNYLIQNTNKAEAEVLQLNQGLQQFNYLLNGLAAFNNQGNGLGIVSRSTTLDLNNFTVYLEPMQKFLAGQKQAIAEAKEMDNAYAKLKQTLISTFGENNIYKDGQYIVTLDQLKAVASEAPLALKYIEQIESKFALLPTSANSTANSLEQVAKAEIDISQSSQSAMESMKQVQAQTQQTTESINEQIRVAEKASKKLKAIRESTIYDQNGQQIGRTSVYGDIGYTKTSRYNENDELTSYTETENFDKIAKNAARAEAEVTKLTTKLNKVHSVYSDKNANKAITDVAHIGSLAEQYNKVENAINQVKTADSNTFAVLKANAEQEISKLQNLVTEYKNAEYAATSLRTKDIGTIKINQQNDLSKFIGQVSGTNVFGTIKSDVDALSDSLSKVTDSKSLTAYLNQLDNVKTKFEALKSLSTTTERNLTTLQSLQNKPAFKNNASNSQVAQTKADISALIGEYQKLQTQLQGNVTPEGLKQLEVELTTLNSRFITATKGATSLQIALAQTNGIDKLKQKTDTLIARLEAFSKANPKAAKQFGSQIDNMLFELKSGKLDAIGVERISKQFQILRSEIQQTGKSGKGFFAKLKDQAIKFSSWMTLTGVITTVWHEMQKMVANVVELDNSLLELSKVSDLSAEGLRNVTKEAYSLGEEVGKTGTQVIDAITNFKRAGFSIEDSTNFAEDALILTNVAEGINDAGEAATALISIMKGYDDTSSEFSQKILDSINEVSNTQAINFDDLVDGSQRLSAVAKQAGMSFEQMLGVLTGTNEVLQNIEKTATGEITIFTRLQGIQLPDEEDVMPIAKLQETISRATKGAANIVDQSTGELRNVYDILNDINKVWDTLDKNTQEGIAFAAAGTRQKNVFLSMMENWENVESATESAMDSMGSSSEENKKYLDSISGKLAHLKSNFQSLSQTVIDSDLIKFVVDAGSNLINVLDVIIDKVGTLPTLLSAISAGLAFKNVGELSNTPVYAQPQLICA